MKKCKICGSQKIEKISPLCSNMKIMGANFSEGNCDIVSCKECGFVYNQYENADQTDFDEYYKSNNSKTVNYYDIFSKNLADEYFEHIFSNIEDYINKDSKILDVAGGYGELAKYLVDKGFPNVTVLEMKDECIEYIKKNGLNVMEGNLLNIVVKEQYDLVVCSHDLEHFIDVDTALKKIMELTNDKGHIYVEIPNIEEYSKLDRAPYHFLTYEHVCHFSENTLRNIERKFSLKMIYLKKYIKCNDYPCLYTVFEKSNDTMNVVRDTTSIESMRIYIEKCRNEIQKSLRKYEESQEPLILWGIGASTAQLLNGCFDQCNVIQLVDSNKSRQGIKFQIGIKEMKVKPPTDICNKEAKIFILPTAYKESIKQSIRNYGLENDIVSLK